MPPNTHPPLEPKPRRWRFPVIGTGLAVIFYFTFRAIVHSLIYETTDDAFIEGPVIPISSKVPGQVTSVHVHENEWVTQEQVLVEIDPRDYEAKLQQKQAVVTTAAANHKTVEATFSLLQARLQTAQSAAKQTIAEAIAAEAAATQSAADFQRSEQLRNKAIISPQEADAARASATRSEANLKAAREKVAGEESKVAEARAQLEAAKTVIGTADAQLSQAQADVRIANLDLSYTRLTAPRPGKITKKAVESGAYVQVGQSLLALVPHEFWVVGNFKETQLGRMRPGQPVTLTISAYHQRTYRGHVDSIQSGAGSRFSLLPPENAVGNYVKIVQRVPVKILFDEQLPEDVVGPGMSVEPSVRVRAMSVPIIALVAAALVASLIVTLLGGLVFTRLRKSAAPAS